MSDATEFDDDYLQSLDPEAYQALLVRLCPVIYRDCECGAYPPRSWRRHFLERSLELEAMTEDQPEPRCQILQLKEKFGTARWYYRHATDEQIEFIERTESEAQKIPVNYERT